MKKESILTLRWNVNKTTLLVFLIGTISVILSFSLKFFNSRISFIILRDILQAGIFGIIIPVIILAAHNAIRESGLNLDKPLRNLGISLALVLLFAIQFYFEDKNALSRLSSGALLPAAYIMLASIFEVIMFFCFLRHFFEKAFGVIPAVILAALFYSLHHAGFQPEFIKLFIVGIVFIGIFRMGKSILIILPVWWFCALWDVLLASDMTKAIYLVTVLQTAIVAFFVCAGTFLIYRNCKNHA